MTPGDERQVGSVEWGDWSAFDDAVDRPLNEVDRRTARRYFNALMAARDERRGELGRLLERNGVLLGSDDSGLQRLDEWYRSHVTGSGPLGQTRLDSEWYAVGLDIGLYLGEAMIERAPTLGWRLFTSGRRDVSYQRPVVMGFRGVAHSGYTDNDAGAVFLNGP